MKIIKLIVLFTFFVFKSHSQNNQQLHKNNSCKSHNITEQNRVHFHELITQLKAESFFTELETKIFQAKPTFKSSICTFEQAVKLIAQKSVRALEKEADVKQHSKEEIIYFFDNLQHLVAKDIGNEDVLKQLITEESNALKQSGGNVNQIQAACTNVDFASGTTAGWTGSYGAGSSSQTSYCDGSVVLGICFGTTIYSNNPTATGGFNTGTINTGANVATGGVHTIMTGGTDPNVPISVVPPNGGNSIRLGNGIANYKAQRLRQTFTVGAANPNFVYQYAVVLDDEGHGVEDQPYFRIRMYDQSNNLINCATYDVDATSASSIPGFSFQAVSSTRTYKYKNWSTVTVPLAAYVGQNVTIEFVTSDCTQGAHFGYAYIQCLCSPIPITSSLPVVCNGQTTTLTAPSGAATYTWTGPGIISGVNTQTAVVNVGGSYTVHMSTFYSPPQVPCTYSQSINIGVAPAPAIPDFTINAVCIGAASTFTNSTTGVGVFQYSWNFGDGSPTYTTATLTDPVHTYTASGNYSVSLSVDNGCPATIVHPLTINPQPTANFTAPNVCLNIATNFTSTASPLASITSHIWDFDDGSATGSGANPVHTFTNPGTYNVTYTVVNSAGCSDTYSNSITVSPNPILSASANTVCLNLTTVFTNSSSVAAPDNIVSWAWDFDNNGTTDNTAQFPTNTFTTVGTHTVELKAITNSGCRDSVNIPVIVNAIQTAVFTASNACVNAPIGLNNLTTVTAPAVINSYNWDFGSDATPATATGYNPTAPSYSTSGVKTITLSLSATPSCTANLVQTIQVYAQPVANFSVSEVCQGNATVFTDLSTPTGSITNWQWDYTNNGSVDANGSSTTFIFPTSGTYTAALIVTDVNTCSDTVKLPYNVWGRAILDFSPEAVCFNASTTFSNQTNITTNANVGTISAYSWNFGDSSPIDMSVSPTHTYPNGVNGATYTTVLTATTSNGCIDQISKTVTVNPLPLPAFTAINACVNSNVVINNTSAIAAPATLSITSWNFGADATPVTSTLTTPTNLTYSTSGVKIITLNLTSSQTCTAVITGSVQVYAQPVANFSTTSVCQASATVFSDLSVPNGSVTNWQWDFTNDGFIDAATNAPTNIYSSSGTYSASLIVTDNNSCKDTIVLPVIVFGHSVPDFTATSVCFGASTTFSNLTSVTTNSNTGTINQYSWNFGDLSAVENTSNPSHTYSVGVNGAIYSVTLTATTSNNCTDNVVKTVTIHPIPSPAFTLTNACVNANVGINNTSTVAAPDNLSNYNWSFGLGALPVTSTIQAPVSLSYTTSGVKIVTLTVTSNNSCTATVTQTVEVYPQPIANFSTTSVCQSTATAFTDLSSPSGSITAWKWDFESNGSIDNTVNAPSFVYPSSGTYTTSLIVTDNNTCKDTVSLVVDVWGHAIPDFTPNAVCYGTVTSFSNVTNTTTNQNIGGTLSYTWNFADGSALDANLNPTHTYTLGGNSNAVYSVTLTATTTHSCVDYAVKTVSVYALPTASFTADSVCLGNSTTFTDASSGNGNTLSSFQWDFMNNGTVDASGATANNTFTNYGAQAISYSVSTNPTFGLTCSNSTNSITAWVNPLPIPDFTFVNKCINAQPNSFDGSASTIPLGTNTLYAWAYGDGNSGSGQTSSHAYATAQLYNATLTVTSNKGCISSITKQVQVYQKPFVSITNSSACDKKAMMFTGNTLPNSAAVANWYWDFNNNAATIEANGQNTSYVFLAAGSQTVGLIAESVIGGCRDTIVKTVFVDYVPVPLFTVDKPAGCPLPHCVTFTDNSLQVPAPSQIVDWKWVFGDGTELHSATNSSQSKCYTNSSSSNSAFYDVKLVVTTDKGCSDSLTKTSFITVYPKPVAQYTVTPNPSSVVTPQVDYINQSLDYTKWWWNFGDNDFFRDSINLNPTHYYNTNDARDYYSYLIVANQYGCRDTAYLKVEIGPDFSFYIPNAFSPENQDGVNDIFTGVGIGIEKYEMWIFDRWGEKIYYTDDIHKGWNGKYKGTDEICKSDVYVWKVRLKNVLGKKLEYVGHVTLVK